MPALNFPYRLQKDNHTCGFLATLMVVEHLRGKTNRKALYKDLGTDERGTSQTAIIRELRRRGITVSLDYDLRFPKVCRQVILGRPIITYRHDLDHWTVIYGYRRVPNRVVVANPNPGRMYQVWFWDKFRKLTQGFGLVCYRRTAKSR